MLVLRYIIERAAVLPGGQRQYAGGYSSSYRGMSGYGGNNTQHANTYIN
jgi:hypothetical protein